MDEGVFQNFNKQNHRLLQVLVWTKTERLRCQNKERDEAN